MYTYFRVFIRHISINSSIKKHLNIYKLRLVFEDILLSAWKLSCLICVLQLVLDIRTHCDAVAKASKY